MNPADVKRLIAHHGWQAMLSKASLVALMIPSTAFLLIFAAAAYAETVNYMYDELNRLKRVSLDNGTVVEYVYDGAGNRLQVQSPDISPPTTTASPSGGLYNVSLSVTLTCVDASGSGCDRIFYTTDGSAPNVSSSVYSSPLGIATTKTLKFFAKDRDGNVETVKTQVYTIDSTAPTGSITINAGAMSTNNPNVTLRLGCTDPNGCSGMKFSSDYFATSTAEETYSPTKAWTLTAGDGYKYVSVKFKDSAGNWSYSYGASITLDTVPPTGTVNINQGAAATNNAAIGLYLTCADSGSGCSSMQVSNDGTTYTTYWYGTPAGWSLISSDGIKTVYVRFGDLAGNWSPVYSDTIVLDTVPPITTASPFGGTYNSARAVTLVCSDGAGSGCTSIYYTTNGSTPTASSPVYSSPINIAASGTIKYFAKDAAGNSESVKTLTYVIDAASPGDAIYAFFESDGLYKYDGPWTKITGAEPETMVMSGSALYAYFVSDGLYRYDGSWTRITGTQPVTMVASTAGLFAFFSSDGLYKYDGAWTRITGTQPASMIASSAGLYAYFSSDGLYKYIGTTLTRISTGQPQSMVASGSVLYAYFASDGLYKYNGTSWTKITGAQPVSMVAANSKLYAYFSSDGLYRHDGSWVKITGTQPASMVASVAGLYAYFSSDGFYRYDGSMTRITAAQPQIVAASGMEVYAWFSGDGLYRYDGLWTKITNTEPGRLASPAAD